MQLQSSHHIKLEREAFKSVDVVALIIIIIINENLVPHILDINILFLIILKTAYVGTITL